MSDVLVDPPSAPLVLTMGDPAGIGPEITLKAWQALRDHEELAFALIAPLAIISRHARALGLPEPRAINTLDHAPSIFKDALPVLPIDGNDIKPGKPHSDAAPEIIKSIETAIQLTQTGQARAVITNPIAKDVLYKAGFAHPGHTEFLGTLTEHDPHPYRRGPVMMLSGGGLNVALATIHMPLSKVITTLTRDAIIHTARVLHDALVCDFGIPNPRINLSGLNPHAGEGGALGREEIDIINPAAHTLRQEGINITNAQSADTQFHTEARSQYDAALAMYHDQGLIPVKTLDFHGGVNITLGLSIIRTSPDHGTAFDIAGQYTARADSLIAAIQSAHSLSQNRARHVAG